ncbi:MAG: DUF2974 domain-containing protein [Ruminococcus sp.]|jgi:hypothetical protein|nr:DUF2974 domain-containing protein [Ruminococcus sp.]
MDFLSPPELERLCCLVYSDDLLNYSAELSLGDIAGDMLRQTTKETPDEYVSNIDFSIVYRDIITNKNLSSLKLLDFYDVPLNYQKDDKTPGNRILVFGNGKKIAVVFRGTHGDAEWADNGARMYQTETKELLDCAAFVNRTFIKFAPDYLVTAGHSGGGNKSMYCFLTCKLYGNYTVNECFSLDGQGFSAEFTDKYSENIKERAEKIIGFAERRDFVNCLGFYALRPPLYFSGARGETILPDYLFGSPLPWFHLPDSLRNSDNEIMTQAEFSYISETINALVTYLLTAPEYADKKKFLCDTIVTLMMDETRKNRTKQAEAIAIILAAAVEIASANHDFVLMIKNIIKYEKRVILSTAIMLFGDITDWGESEFLALIKKMFKKHSSEDFCNSNDECKRELNNALCECDSGFKAFSLNVG